jgi:hypothetical protein
VRRAVTLAVVAAALLAMGYLAVAPEYYRIRWLHGEISDETLLRKAYSLAAFTLAGLLLSGAQRRLGGKPAIAGAVALVALFSAAIEIAQRLAGSHETLGWNAIDVAFGAAGGALGGYLERAAATYGKR